MKKARSASIADSPVYFGIFHEMNDDKKMFSPRLLLFSAAFLVATRLCPAAETDNFSSRLDKLAKLRDSSVVLDEFINEAIETAVSKANSVGSCDRDRLFHEARVTLDRNPVGEIERFAEADPRVQNYLVDFKQSVYGDVSANDPGLSVIARLFILTGWFDSTIRVGDTLIGTDKLGHFFGQGFEYFEAGNALQGMALGISEEEGIDGYTGSGVYSYGDLSANIDGFRFWQNFLDGKNPYIRCKNGAFEILRKFFIKDYVNSSWDEALNCSKYATQRMADAVASNLQKKGLSCPIDPAACKKMATKPCAYYTVSPVCFKIAGLSPEINKRQCDRSASKIENLDCQNCTSTPLTSTLKENMDDLWGLVTLPFHFIYRNWNSK